MECLAGYHDNETSLAEAADAPHEMYEGNERRASLFKAHAHIAKVKQEELEASSWETIPEEERRATCDAMFSKRHEELQAKSVKAMIDITTTDCMAILFCSDEAIQRRMLRTDVVQFRTTRPILFAIRDNRYVVIPSDLGNEPWSCTVS
jgi:hypothetical protein